MFEKLISEGWQFIETREGCEIFRRVEAGRGRWCAIIGGKVEQITYDQALGYEALTSTGKLARKLGKALLPNSSQRV